MPQPFPTNTTIILQNLKKCFFFVTDDMKIVKLSLALVKKKNYTRDDNKKNYEFEIILL